MLEKAIESGLRLEWQVRRPAPHVELFATNLRTPSHMEWTPEGRLLVSEHTAGEVKDITEGGDMRTVAPFAYGLQGPASILPLDDGRILVSETFAGRVTDIGSGGDLSNADSFAHDLWSPYSLTRLGGRIFVDERATRAFVQVTEITDGGGRPRLRPHLVRVPQVPMPGLEGLALPGSDAEQWAENSISCGGWSSPIRYDGDAFLVKSNSALGQIVKVPAEGGDYLDLVENGFLIASGLGWQGGKIQHPYDELIYVTQPQRGTIMAVDPGASRDYRFAPPVIQGLNTPTCVRFSRDGNAMFVCSMPTGTVWRITNFA